MPRWGNSHGSLLRPWFSAIDMNIAVDVLAVDMDNIFSADKAILFDALVAEKPSV
jgi:hypothetical protein